MGQKLAEPFKHPKTGVYYARKVIPERLRAVIGKREFRQSLHTKDIKEAKLRQLEALAKFEALVAQAETGPATLSHLQIVALAGEWYRRELADWEHDPVSSAEEWAIALDPLQQAEERGQSAEAVAGEVEALLAAECLIVDAGSRRKLADRVFWLKVRLFNRLGKRADGDYSADPFLNTVPAWKRPVGKSEVPASGSQVTFASLLDGWELERKPKAKTAAEWKRTVERFATFVEHDDPTRVVRADVIRWKEAMLKTDMAQRSVKAHLDGLRTILAWAEENGRISANPARKITVAIKRDASKDRRKYSEEEAGVILGAARKEQQSRRWGPWLLAYTGARVEEVCGAAAADIKREDGIDYFDLTGRDLKTRGSERRIPLHPALIAEGFLKYVEGLPKGSPLFPDLKVVRYGKRGVEWSKWYGRWCDRLGITDKRLVAHSWRHRFKDWCRDAEVPQEVHDALTGHVSGGEGGKYGDGASLKVLAAAVRKLPAIKVERGGCVSPKS